MHLVCARKRASIGTTINFALSAASRDASLWGFSAEAKIKKQKHAGPASAPPPGARKYYLRKLLEKCNKSRRPREIAYQSGDQLALLVENGANTARGKRARLCEKQPSPLCTKSA